MPTEYQVVPLALLVMPRGDVVYSEMVTRVEITDETGGPFLLVTQPRSAETGDGIAIQRDEWPAPHCHRAAAHGLRAAGGGGGRTQTDRRTVRDHGAVESGGGDGMSELLTAREVAALLKLDEAHVRDRLSKRRDFPPAYRVGGLRRMRADILDWIEAQKVSPAARRAKRPAPRSTTAAS